MVRLVRRSWALKGTLDMEGRPVRSVALMGRKSTLCVRLTHASGALIDRLPAPSIFGTLRVAEDGALCFAPVGEEISFSAISAIGALRIPTGQATLAASVVAHHDLGGLSGHLRWTGRGRTTNRVCTLEVGLLGAGPQACARFDYKVGYGRDSRPYERVCEVFAFARHLEDSRAALELPHVELGGIRNSGTWRDLIGEAAERCRTMPG